MKLIRVPRNIFQTWETKYISTEFKKLTDTWCINNPNYAYFLHDKSDRERLIKKYFGARVYNVYCRLIPGAFKADLWRYCILFIYGGVYADIDSICMGEIDTFLNEDIEFMTSVDLNNCPSMGTHNLSNGMIASIPNHPILLECINRIVYNVENNIVPPSNLDLTGPGILGRATNTFFELDETTSFIGKEGIHNNTVHLLKFEHNTEYIKDSYDNILLQNKNGNREIQRIYENEKRQIAHVDWGSCRNPIKVLETNPTPPTIVTMFYDRREKEKDKYKQSRDINEYFEHAKKFILGLQYNLIVFTDCDKCIEFVSKERENMQDKTYIYKKRFEDTHYYKHLDKLHELQNKFHIINGVIEQETPIYIILNNNKFDFMESAISLNPFNSERFVWMDFGINHVALNSEKIHEWINNIPEKIKQLCINPYIENVAPKQMFQYIYHHMAGGLFSGSSANLLKYCNLFKQKTEEIYNDDWYQIDEAVMTIVQRENPGIFELYYGDYQGIISNYTSPIHNMNLILRGAQKYIDANRTKDAYNMLCYCLQYFLDNPTSNLTNLYIEQHIIVDYYNNNKVLLEDVIRLIHLKMTSPNNSAKEEIHALLEKNKANINYYENKYHITNY